MNTVLNYDAFLVRLLALKAWVISKYLRMGEPRSDSGTGLFNEP